MLITSNIGQVQGIGIICAPGRVGRVGGGTLLGVGLSILLKVDIPSLTDKNISELTILEMWNNRGLDIWIQAEHLRKQVL